MEFLHQYFWAVVTKRSNISFFKIWICFHFDCFSFLFLTSAKFLMTYKSCFFTTNLKEAFNTGASGMFFLCVGAYKILVLLLTETFPIYFFPFSQSFELHTLSKRVAKWPWAFHFQWYSSGRTNGIVLNKIAIVKHANPQRKLRIWTWIQTFLTIWLMAKLIRKLATFILEWQTLLS